MVAEEAAKKVQATLTGQKLLKLKLLTEKKPEVNGSILDTLKKKFGQK